MKFYQIAVFVFVLNISIMMINQTGAFPNSQKFADSGLINNTIDTANTESALGSGIDTGNDFSRAVGDAFKGIGLFTRAVFTAPFAISAMITDMFPNSTAVEQFAFMISAIISFIYIAALIQVIANRGFRGMS